MKLILIFTIIFISNNAFAFNWKKCSSIAMSGNGVGLFLSTTSYPSSTSECSALGKVEDNKKLFIVQNLEEMQVDISRGRGEYLEAYASLSGCNQNAKNDFSALLQKNYARIYGEQSDNKPRPVYEAIEVIIKSDSLIRASCRGNS